VSRVSLSDEAYARLLVLRTGLRHFQRWSEQQARTAGLTPAQHQLLLAVRGHRDPRGPTIGEVADYLLLRHHSVVGLIDRTDEAGLVTRERDTVDHRVVRLHLTDEGARRLEALSALHLEEIERLATELPWEGLGPVHRTHGSAAPTTARTTSHLPSPGAPPPTPHAAPPAQMDVLVARVRDAPGPGVPKRVLVDRLWPRGLARAEAPFDEWSKEVAPSSALRRWYGHRPDRADEFRARYLAELAEDPARGCVDDLRRKAGNGGVVLLTATRDLALSHATVLAELLRTG
jgi:uncharacterized protein YeaO (DUF488 family)/DNA-binding MarR family transcriptional regulator